MTVAALWAAVLEAPLDDGLKLVLADALAEAGDETTERAVRWCVAKKKWPHDSKKDAPRMAGDDGTRYGFFGGVRFKKGRPVPVAKVVRRFRLPLRIWKWYQKGRPLTGYNDGATRISRSPFPLCRDDRIEVVLYRLGLALAWAEGRK